MAFLPPHESHVWPPSSPSLVFFLLLGATPMAAQTRAHLAAATKGHRPCPPITHRRRALPPCVTTAYHLPLGWIGCASSVHLVWLTAGMVEQPDFIWRMLRFLFGARIKSKRKNPFFFPIWSVVAVCQNPLMPTPLRTTVATVVRPQSPVPAAHRRLTGLGSHECCSRKKEEDEGGRRGRPHARFMWGQKCHFWDSDGWKRGVGTDLGENLAYGDVFGISRRMGTDLEYRPKYGDRFGNSSAYHALLRICPKPPIRSSQQ